MKRKLIISMLVVAITSIILALGFVLPRLYQAFEQRALQEMSDMAAILSGSMELAQDKEAFLEEMKQDIPQFRLSWIGTTGEVLYDSEVAQVSDMENHAGREEVLKAFQTGSGSGSRLSSSLGESTYYFARRLSDGSVIRVAQTRRTIVAELIGLLPSFILIMLLAIAIPVILAELFTKRLIEPINNLNLDEPEKNEVDEELAPLLRRLMQQNRYIQEQLRVNRENTRKTLAITENMAEGMLMLSVDGHIVSINRSAARLLGGQTESFCGLHYITICRDINFQRNIERVLSGERNESKMVLAGRTIHVLADPVFDENELNGAVILLLDITENERAEASRREFSANVSHELKTPLTTIAGYAEMMEAGLSNAKDNVNLAGKILGEAKRLLMLIEDIIKLSKLDEGTGQTETELVDLYALAQSVVDRMAHFASQKGVRVELTGETQYVMGSKVLLEEMLQNLLDNAIRYNHPGGDVKMTISQEGALATVNVIDTGVGIAPEHQDRVFERFYRVDKSHSRETGGTGLGLSIVKHCVQNLGGTVKLTSVPGEGTNVEIELPQHGLLASGGVDSGAV